MTKASNLMVTLPSGRKIPALAFGTGTKWYKRNANSDTITNHLNRDLITVIKSALSIGIRHIDTAEMYGTEGEVGVAVREFMMENPSVKREDIFLTSKIWNGMVDVRESIERGLKLAGLPYWDLYLIHSPFIDRIPNLPPDTTFNTVWKELEKAQRDGLIREIGLSNFDRPQLETLYKDATILPAINQIEYHPLLPQPMLLADMTHRHLPVAAYGPLIPIVPSTALGDKVTGTAEGQEFLNTLNNISKRLGVSPGGVLLRWNLDHGHVVVTTSSTIDRIKEFSTLDQVPSLSADENNQISSLATKIGKFRRFWPAELFLE